MLLEVDEHAVLHKAWSLAIASHGRAELLGEIVVAVAIEKAHQRNTPPLGEIAARSRSTASARRCLSRTTLGHASTSSPLWIAADAPSCFARSAIVWVTSPSAA